MAFHGFWPGFRLESFLAFHPYLKLECNVGECRRRPDVDFINVGYGRLRRDAHDIPLPGNGRPTVFYTGERVSPGTGALVRRLEAEGCETLTVPRDTLDRRPAG